jgi:5,5'-dehydrodivanillate O-demethylase
MMTDSENERLTRVGKGTPMGELLRRYWHAIATTVDLDDDPVRRVRLLGEDLTLFRSESGELGLIGDRCPHRGVDLQFGIPDAKGLRCPYHGWLFDKKGHCLEIPFDDRIRANAVGHERMNIAGYPVQELGGLIYAYLGPQPVPLLPRWDLLVQDKFDRGVEVHVLPCNWLQCMDNSADPVHFEYTHAALGNYALKKQGKPPAMKIAKHVKIAFDRFKYGMMKRRLLEGESEDVDDWTVGHPLLFPNILAQGAADAPTLQIRTPIDDTNTLHIRYRTQLRASGAAPKPLKVVHEKLFNEHGKIVPNKVPLQDMLVWIAQGPISNRSREHLAASDTGIVLYRRMLNEALEAVERGEDPMGVIRAHSENEPWIDLHREAETLKPFESKYKGLLSESGSVAVAGE